MVEATADGNLDTVYIPITGNWSEKQPFSNNWQNIKATVITPKAGKTITPGGNQPASGDYDVSYMMGDYLYTYKGRNTEVDEDAHIQHDEFVLELKKAKFESAIDPYDVLGEGAEYGVIANKYTQESDSETNFAAKVFENRSGDFLKVGEGGSVGDGVVPFYVGKVVGDKDLKFGAEITVDCDVYVNKDYADRVVPNPAGHIEVTKYPMTESDVDAVVDGFIDKLRESSTNYKKESLTLRRKAENLIRHHCLIM